MTNSFDGLASAAAKPAGAPDPSALETQEGDADEMMDGQEITDAAAIPASAGAGKHCSMQREAAYNLSLIYQASGADDLAREVMRLHLQV